MKNGTPAHCGSSRAATAKPIVYLQKGTLPNMEASQNQIRIRIDCFPTLVLTNRFKGSGFTFSTPKSPPANAIIPHANGDCNIPFRGPPIASIPENLMKHTMRLCFPVSGGCCGCPSCFRPRKWASGNGRNKQKRNDHTGHSAKCVNQNPRIKHSRLSMKFF